MHFNLYLDEKTADRLKLATENSSESRNAIIRKAIKLWLDQSQNKTWPDELLNFKGITGVPAFESHRDDLKEANEDPFV